MTLTLIRNALPSYTGPIEPHHDLRGDLNADELTIHTIALDLGDRQGRDIPEAEYAGWTTVADVLESGEVAA